MYKILIWILLGFLLSCNTRSTIDSRLLEFIDDDHPLLENVFADPDKYELQIRYTQIQRSTEQTPSFKTYTYNFDSLKYFYPASTVKMPVAFLALEKLNNIKSNKEPYIDRNTSMIHHVGHSSQSAALMDSTSSTGLPSIAHYINKLFVVSDNEAYNRLYEWLGQDYINEKLIEKGIFSTSRITHRVGVSGYDEISNTFTNPVEFLNPNGDQLMYQPQDTAIRNNNHKAIETKKGKGFYVDNTETIMGPFDMSFKNFINLKDLESSLMKVVFPSAFDKHERFNLSDDQYEFLYESMLKLPKDYPFLNSNTVEEYYDGYVKFFMYGDSQDDIPRHVKIMNKVGFAYGYLTDCAYIFDTERNIEFFLSATIHVNENEIYNDGIYEYDEIGLPFLAELGRQIYDHEINRKRAVIPNFNRFLNQKEK